MKAKFLEGVVFFSVVAGILLVFGIVSYVERDDFVFEEFPMPVAGGKLHVPPKPPETKETTLTVYEVRDAESCEADGDIDDIAANDPAEAARRYVQKYWPGGFDGRHGPHRIVVKGKVYKVTIKHVIKIRSRPEKSPKYLEPPKCRRGKK
jgi:hypothetical protein